MESQFQGRHNKYAWLSLKHLKFPDYKIAHKCILINWAESILLYSSSKKHFSWSVGHLRVPNVYHYRQLVFSLGMEQEMHEPLGKLEAQA